MLNQISKLFLCQQELTSQGGKTTNWRGNGFSTICPSQSKREKTDDGVFFGHLCFFFLCDRSILFEQNKMLFCFWKIAHSAHRQWTNFGFLNKVACLLLPESLFIQPLYINCIYMRFFCQHCYINGKCRYLKSQSPELFCRVNLGMCSLCHLWWMGLQLFW